MENRNELHMLTVDIWRVVMMMMVMVGKESYRYNMYSQIIYRGL